MKLVDSSVPGPRREYVGYGEHTPQVRWPDGASVALTIAVNFEEGSEYSLPAGDGRNETVAEIESPMDHDFRDLDVESVYEYGSRAGVWRLLRLFEEYAIRVTFFAAAVALERNPTVGQYIERAGHEPCSHGWRWEEPWRLERDEERQHIQWAIESFQDTCGQRPVGWFSRYSPSVNTRDLLVEEGGFLYDSDAFNDDLPYFTQVNGAEHLIVPYTHVYNDGRYAIAPHIGGPSDFVDICKRGMSELRREGHIGHPKMMSIGLHPRWAGQAARTSAVREVIEYALELSDIWIATRRDIAEWWIDHHEEF